MHGPHSLRHLPARPLGRGLQQDLLFLNNHPPGERNGHHPHSLDIQFDAEQDTCCAVQVQGGRRTARALCLLAVAFLQPAFLEQLANELAHGGFGEAAGRGQLGARQTGLRPNQAQQQTSVDALDTLQIPRGAHRVWDGALPSGCLPAMIIPSTSSSVTLGVS